jgi:hypothetical protein
MMMSMPAAAATALRQRIGWLCHLLRFAALGYAAWVLGLVILHWSSAERVARVYGGWLKADLSGVQMWQRLAGFSISLVIWAFAAAACYSVWRLFSGYLAGRIFTVDAATWLRRIGSFGLIAQVIDVVARPLTTALVTLHLPADARHVAFAFNPNDLVFVLFLCGFIALAHVYKAAAEIADDNAQFV